VLDCLVAVVEDPLEVMAHECAMKKLAQRPKRQRVANRIEHQDVVAGWLEAVGVVPQAIGDHAPAHLRIGAGGSQSEAAVEACPCRAVYPNRRRVRREA
jgi:hypothetical protein